MFRQETVLKLVDLIYSAAGDSTKWTDVLTELAQTLQGTSATIHHQDLVSLESSFSASCNVDPAALERYTQYYGALNVWFKHSQEISAEGSAYTSQMLYPDQALVRTEFYNDWLRGTRMRHGTGATVFRNGRATSVISAFRWEDKTFFGENELALLRLLLPHLQRAFQLHAKIQGLEQKGEAISDALDQLQQGVVLLDTKGCVLLVNRAASALFTTETVLRLTPRGVHSAAPSENRQLSHLIESAAATGNGKGLSAGGVLSISRGGIRRPLQVLVTPVRTKSTSFGKKVPAVAIFISDPDRQADSDPAVFAQLFGLTPAEARLAQVLSRGENLRDAADQLGVAQSTVRSQLKSIFGKTNTRRQSELVRLVLLAPARMTQRQIQAGSDGGY